MAATIFDQLAATRNRVRDLRVTYTHGQRLTVVVQLSAAQLEQWRRDGEIEPDASCVQCGEHVTECDEIGHLLVDWPERILHTAWGQSGTAAELGLVVFA